MPVATPEPPVKDEKAKAEYAEVTMKGYDTESGELLIGVRVDNLPEFDKMPQSSSGKTRKLTNGAMSAIGIFRGDFPASINGVPLRLQVGLYGDVK